MRKGSPLSNYERKLITQKLAKGFSAVQIGQHLGRDKRTIRKAIKNINYSRKPHCNKVTSIISTRDLQKIKDVLRKHPLLTSKVIFSKAGVPNISKATQNRVLKQVGSVK